MNDKDTLYTSTETPTPFRFNKQVSAVFDNMAQRSIPGYNIQQDFIAHFTLQFLHAQGSLLDLGSSLGKSLVHISNTAQEKHIPLSQNNAVLCDSSIDMVDRCKKNITPITAQWNNVHVMHLDITDTNKLQSLLHSVKDTLQVIILHYVLQFIDPSLRFAIARSMWDSLQKGGILLLGEKLRSEHPTVQQIWQQQHSNFKLSHGYSRNEIQKKQQALQNILVPTSYLTMNNFIQSLHASHVSTYFSFGEFFCYCIIK